MDRREWSEENIWSGLMTAEEKEIMNIIDVNWEELNQCIDDVFAGKKIKIKKLK